MFSLLIQRWLRWLRRVNRMKDGRIPKDILYSEFTMLQRQACDERRKEQWDERKERGQLRAASVPTEPSTEFICNNGNRACRSRIGQYRTAGAAAQPLTNKPWRQFHCPPRQMVEEPTVNFKSQHNLQISLLSTSKYLTKL